MSPLLKNIGTVLVISSFLGVGYYMYSGSSQTDDIVNDDGALAKASVLLLDTKKVNEYSIDTTLLSDPRFVSLQDTRVPLQKVPVGRANPFTPLP